RQSRSRTKFSNARSVRSIPAGLPEQTIIPSRTVQVLGPPFTTTQPERLRPSKRGTNPPSSPRPGPPAQADPTTPRRRGENGVQVIGGRAGAPSSIGESVSPSASALGSNRRRES